MFGLTVEKLLLIGLLPAFLIGPRQLPVYAQKLGALVRTVRDFADTVKVRAAEELGPEFDQTDWKKLDPRQYDPRRIVRDALADDDTTVPAVPAALDPTPALTPARPRAVAPGGWQEALLARTKNTVTDAAVSDKLSMSH
ncbi:Sec-independent protein translocase TatB [Herbiconiux sp.]|uniref:Sec-independent protein translocase TatB n=1 Tax=Herbiconiux sp. TaxID=1871186 RepID=UPI0025BCF050|nr:Sec-independent protein translocase TatB [Herbiconiux sp.]